MGAQRRASPGGLVTVQTRGGLRAIPPFTEGQPSTEFALQADSVPSNVNSYVDSTSPRWGEKASFYSAVCLETGEVEWLELEGNSNSATSAAFLRQLREQHARPLTVIWDNSPAHRGDVLRAYLATTGLRLRLVNPVSSTVQALPGYSPDFNADEAIWNWVRQEVTANPVSSTGQALCLGTKSAVQEKVNNFFTQLAGRQPEVKQRCRTVLQTRAEGLLGKVHADPRRPTNVDPTLVSV